MSKTDKAGNDLSADRVYLVAQNILAGWVCAPKHMDKDAVQTAVLRDVFPCGTTNGWQVQEIVEGEPDQISPGRCAEDCDRQHWKVFA